MQVLLVACGCAHLPHIARVLQGRNALAGLWISNKLPPKVDPAKFRRAWRFHLAMKPIYHLASQGAVERAYYLFQPLWTSWVRAQKPPPFDAVHALLGFGEEPFEHAEKVGALKVVDASTSHPTSFFGFWQRECDIWNPGHLVGVPRKMFARCNRDLERADVILCPSKFVLDSMLYNGIPQSKCILNPYGVDTSVFSPRSGLPEKTRFISVGGISLLKGHQYLFRAFQKVRQAIPDAELICCGVYYADFKKERPRWEGTFTHYPRLPHSELSALLKQCTGFVLASNQEGLARAIPEAMAAGLPIIATYQSGATTLVDDGVEGLILNSRDVEGLANAMIKIARDRDLNDRMGKAARTRGAQGNSWEDYGERLLKIYADALNRLRARS